MYGLRDCFMSLRVSNAVDTKRPLPSIKNAAPLGQKPCVCSLLCKGFGLLFVLPILESGLLLASIQTCLWFGRAVD